jgi:hypothetical protein
LAVHLPCRCDHLLRDSTVIFWQFTFHGPGMSISSIRMVGPLAIHHDINAARNKGDSSFIDTTHITHNGIRNSSQCYLRFTLSPEAKTECPSALILRAAFISRSCSTPHSGHLQFLTDSFKDFIICRQSEQRLVDGNH